MKKVLIIDPLSFSGHVNYNFGIISAISQNYDYRIAVNEYMHEKLMEKCIPADKFSFIYPNSWNIVSLSKKFPKIVYHILYRLYFLRVVLWAMFHIREYDYIIMTSVDIFTFPLLSYMFGKKCAVVDHGIGNLADNTLYLFCWKLCANNIRLIVLEEFIKEMVVDYMPSRKIYVIKHPLPIINKVSDYEDNSNNIFIFAPSNSNDESYLKLLPNEKLDNNITIYAKSQKYEFSNPTLTISKKYISSDNYYDYFQKAKLVLLPYDNEYNYRISAVLFEALVFNKKIILLNNNTLTCYKKYFPNNIVLQNINEPLQSVVYKALDIPISQPDLQAYSLEQLAKAILDLIN